MLKIVKIVVLAIASSAFLSGCLTRITTGEVGVRVDMSRQVQGSELQPGSWNQTVIGDVLTFPVKDIAVQLENKSPMTSDNSALSDFDITVVYAITPSAAAELFTTKSKSFHLYDEKEGDTLLMYNYMTTLVNNAAYKAVRQYRALEVADNRAKLEQDIRDIVAEQLKQENLDTALTLTVVQIRNVAPNADILKAATDFVRSQNELKIKENEVKIAEAEARRMAALAQNSSQSIQYMEAQSKLLIAQAVKEGKVNTILIPHGVTMLGGNLGK